MRVLVVILASSLCWGCFVLDEIDAGQKEMDRYDGKGAAKESSEAPAAGAKAETESPQARMRKWWDGARTFSPRADDAKSDVVSCKLAGTVRFMSQGDCQNSGGRIVGG
jgi:hypothetical protein